MLFFVAVAFAVAVAVAAAVVDVVAVVVAVFVVVVVVRPLVITYYTVYHMNCFVPSHMCTLGEKKTRYQMNRAIFNQLLV